MAFNYCHSKRCAINTRSSLANCTCGFTTKQQKKVIAELRSQLELVEKQCQENGRHSAEKTLEIDRLKKALKNIVYPGFGDSLLPMDMVNIAKQALEGK